MCASMMFLAGHPGPVIAFLPSSGPLGRARLRQCTAQLARVSWPARCRAGTKAAEGGGPNAAGRIPGLLVQRPVELAAGADAELGELPHVSHL